MTLFSFLAKDKYMQLQSVCFYKSAKHWRDRGLVLSLVVSLSLPSVIVSNAAFAGNGGAERRDHSNNRHASHNNSRHKYGDNYRHHRHRHHRSYYPWGLGLGLGLGSGWSLGYGWNDGNWSRARYWNSPYSGIGLSIPMAYEDTSVAVSSPERVTTSMQYSPSERRMVSNTPSNAVAQLASQTNINQVKTANNAVASKARVAHSMSSLPNNARIVQQDGRTLYEWQGVLYAFDWNTQIYHEQLVK